ncbi:MAG: 23S rRNA (uracil(1939)-C(5))-methyltransferase RlmD [Erysipelotrichaceae bacterium]|nr:23S rRNA (uracil(1939)-C(5))-methyltransferase RlmD [Erysipelotrichaceae bacterium]
MKVTQIEIKKLGINGEGIGYINKKVCFVDNALPGEVVEVELDNNNSRYYKGKVKKYIKQSSYRQKTICKEDEHCLGCSLTCYQYDQQLFYKKDLLKDALRKYTKLPIKYLPLKNTVPAHKTVGYKDVVSLPVTYFQGKVRFGIYQRESKYLTLMDQCVTQNPIINECLQQVEDILNDCHVRDYNEKFKKGLRFIRMRLIGGQIQILFVTGNDGIKDEAVKRISQIPIVKAIWYTINTARYQDFDKKGYTKLYGDSKFSFDCLNKQYQISIKADYPINSEAEETKLSLIQSMIDEGHILSLNCGIGVLELSLDNDIIAVDERKENIQDALDNKELLDKHNVQFVCKNVDEAVINYCKKNSFDYMIVRGEGLSDTMIQSMILSKIKNVILVSDHPSALSKNLEEIKDYYKIKTMIPLDSYPYTAKFDTIVHLVKH